MFDRRRPVTLYILGQKEPIQEPARKSLYATVSPVVADILMEHEQRFHEGQNRELGIPNYLF